MVSKRCAHSFFSLYITEEPGRLEEKESENQKANFPATNEYLYADYSILPTSLFYSLCFWFAQWSRLGARVDHILQCHRGREQSHWQALELLLMKPNQQGSRISPRLGYLAYRLICSSPFYFSSLTCLSCGLSFETSVPHFTLCFSI